MTSISRLPEKERRKARRRNHIARDLAKSKYHQRIIPDARNKYKDKGDNEYFFNED